MVFAGLNGLSYFTQVHGIGQSHTNNGFSNNSKAAAVTTHQANQSQ